ncbi:MAG: uroporphyrinogen-III synthase [Terriglobales bacterium]|jgi:uroporphyrinogen-III synthase
MKPNENHPLAGTRILVGRARHQAGSLSASLRSLGASVIEIPFIEIRKPQSYRPLDDALKNIKSYDWLILTSANGVEAMWERVRKLRITRRNLNHLQIAAIGPATKKAIVKHGLKVKMVPEEYIAEAVVKKLRDKVNGKRVVLIRAKVARDVIPEELRAAGAEVDVVEAYETVVPEKSRARLRALMKNKGRRPHVVIFTSSSTAKNFAELLGNVKADLRSAAWLKHVQFASIGPVTSATLGELQLPVAIEAREFTMGGLIRAIVLARYAEGGNH